MKKISLPSEFNFVIPFLKMDSPYLSKLGGFKDGSYVCDFRAILSTELLISGGVGSNVRFESDFYDINKQVKVVLIDPTVSIVRMLARAFYHFFKKNQSGFRSFSEVFNYFSFKRKSILIKKYLDKDFDIHQCLITYDYSPKNIFLKLDIEGSEYDLLTSILSFKNNFTGICIEFHGLNIPSNIIILKKFINDLDFNILHISINEAVFEESIPCILEFSFAPKIEVSSSANVEKSVFLQTSNTFDNELVYFDFD